MIKAESQCLKVTAGLALRVGRAASFPRHTFQAASSDHGPIVADGDDVEVEGHRSAASEQPG